jgi:hypothetical protein
LGAYETETDGDRGGSAGTPPTSTGGCVVALGAKLEYEVLKASLLLLPCRTNSSTTGIPATVDFALE